MTESAVFQRFQSCKNCGLKPIFPHFLKPANKGNTLYYVAFVDRGDVRRTISLRLAERREVKKYVENIQ